VTRRTAGILHRQRRSTAGDAGLRSPREIPSTSRVSGASSRWLRVR